MAIILGPCSWSMIIESIVYLVITIMYKILTFVHSLTLLTWIYNIKKYSFIFQMLSWCRRWRSRSAIVQIVCINLKKISILNMKWLNFQTDKNITTRQSIELISQFINKEFFVSMNYLYVTITNSVLNNLRLKYAYRNACVLSKFPTW